MLSKSPVSLDVISFARMNGKIFKALEKTQEVYLDRIEQSGRGQSCENLDDYGHSLCPGSASEEILPDSTRAATADEQPLPITAGPGRRLVDAYELPNSSGACADNYPFDSYPRPSRELIVLT